MPGDGQADHSGHAAIGRATNAVGEVRAATSIEPEVTAVMARGQEAIAAGHVLTRVVEDRAIRELRECRLTGAEHGKGLLVCQTLPPSSLQIAVE